MQSIDSDLTGEEQQAARFSGRTAWARSLETPLRSFLRTETGSAAVLLGATIAALAWVNADSSSYERVWHTTLSIRVGGSGVSQDLRHWLNDGLMTFFFFVVGLEARREFDMGELRERRRLALPVAAGIGGMAVPVAIFLAANAGRPSAHGWGVAMSTDTAFALGMLALVGPRFPDRLRAFMLTVVVVDDVVALLVIATVYTKHRGVLAAARRGRAVRGDPGDGPLERSTRAGLLPRSAGRRGSRSTSRVSIRSWPGSRWAWSPSRRPAARVDLERATDLFRLFREQPTPELARSARVGLRAAISPNERLQHLFHPWTSYVIVPLFALANAGIAINGGFLGRAFSSPITLGILVGYLVGKPIGILGASWLVTRLSRGRLRPPVGWAAVAGGGAIAGIGFTVSLLIATLAFHGAQLNEAKLGVLSAGNLRVARDLARLPHRGLASAAPADPGAPRDGGDDRRSRRAGRPDRDHIRGPEDAPVTLVEYGDFECPYCGQAEPVVRELLRDFGDVRYVWRHLPLNDVHPHAQLAAEAAEAAAEQGAFWEMHDLLLDHQDALRPTDLTGYAEQLGLDIERFTDDLRRHTGGGRVAEDVDGADLSGVSGTPTFFINGRRHYGAYDIDTSREAVRAARAR